MPNYKTHLGYGLLYSFLALAIFDDITAIEMNTYLEILLLFVVCMVWSILPDIDHQNSKMTALFTICCLGLGITLIFFNIYFAVISFIILIIYWVLQISNKIKHRGMLHTMTAGGLISLPLLYFGFIVYICGVVSYAVHLILDKLMRGK